MELLPNIWGRPAAVAAGVNGDMLGFLFEFQQSSWIFIHPMSVRCLSVPFKSAALM